MKGNRIKKSREDIIFDVVSYTIISLLILVCFYPMWYVFCASFTDPTIVAKCKGVLLWPQKINLDAYRRVFSNPEIWTGYKNTLIYTVAGTLLNVMLTAMLAYALSRKNVLLKKPLTFMISFTMFFNGGMIPTYLVVKSLGLLDTASPSFFPDWCKCSTSSLCAPSSNPSQMLWKRRPRLTVPISGRSSGGSTCR